MRAVESMSNNIEQKRTQPPYFQSKPTRWGLNEDHLQVQESRMSSSRSRFVPASQNIHPSFLRAIVSRLRLESDALPFLQARRLSDWTAKAWALSGGAGSDRPEIM